MNRLVGGFLISILLFSVGTVPPTTQAVEQPRDPSSPETLRGGDTQTALEHGNSNSTLPANADRVFLQIHLYGNGTAAWRLEYWIRLEERTITTEFRQFQQHVRDAPASSGVYDRVRQSVAGAEEATGREMAGSGFEARTTVRHIPQKYGVVVYRFRWRGFAAVSDRRLRVGDALQGLFLGSGERLTISWPERYELTEVAPAPDTKQEHTVTWHGPRSFGLNGPQLVLVDRSRSVSRLVPFGTVVFAVALIVVFRRIRDRRDILRTALVSRVLGDERDDTELLSNEERVIRLVEERGGRIKQRKVSDELGWTESKTSYVVSNLRREGRIHTFRLGRENVLSLSDAQDISHPET